MQHHQHPCGKEKPLPKGVPTPLPAPEPHGGRGHADVQFPEPPASGSWRVASPPLPCWALNSTRKGAAAQAFQGRASLQSPRACCAHPKPAPTVQALPLDRKPLSWSLCFPTSCPAQRPEPPHPQCCSGPHWVGCRGLWPLRWQDGPLAGKKD